MDRIAFAFELKSANDAGVFEGYASTFGNKDQGGDIVERGAFARTLKEKGYDSIVMLKNHNRDDVIGVWEEMREDERGLYVRGRILVETTSGRDTYIQMKNKALKGMSIGGYTTNGSPDGRKRARIIKEFDLHEISVVTFPMNVMAQIGAVKSLDVDVIRAMEADFRKELNLSNASAVSAVAIVKKHLREGGEINHADASREADAKAIADLTARFRAISG
jgi:uncharacterized protein